MKHIKSIFVASLVVFLGCETKRDLTQNQSEDGSTDFTGRVLRVGMGRDVTIKLLSDSGCIEVPKDVWPDGKGWSVGSNSCLFLSFTNDVLARITIEEHSDKPKAFRRFLSTNIYKLPDSSSRSGGAK